jgi:hypothetical protein
VSGFLAFTTAAPVANAGLTDSLTSAGSILGSAVGNPGSANKDNLNVLQDSRLLLDHVSQNQ